MNGDLDDGLGGIVLTQVKSKEAIRRQQAAEMTHKKCFHVQWVTQVFTSNGMSVQRIKHSAQLLLLLTFLVA